jgi:hypothetical protein
VSLLHQAQICAQQLQRSPWDFAVGIRLLLSAGATENDLRWLVRRGFAEHACEQPKRRGSRRSFDRVAGLAFHVRTCFILTPTGVERAREFLIQDTSSRDSSVPAAGHRTDAAASLPIPHWDGLRRTLVAAGIAIKEFRQPAPDQIRVLETFEEEHWTYRIDDPLPCLPGRNPKQRLHVTIANLNRNQRKVLIQFKGDGTGQGVCWTWRTKAALKLWRCYRATAEPV